ncbi:hypothetical protein GF377_04265 [candidate division GN15 bacterium]|nr:hypothetical protein [candidate division GN15 bacterium]
MLLSRLPIADTYDVVVGAITGDFLVVPRWDWAPNPGDGHATYVIDRSYPGDIGSKKSARNPVARRNRHISASYPQPFD